MGTTQIRKEQFRDYFPLGDETPQPVSETGAVGSSGSASHSNHVHAHGDLLGGSLHALSTSGSAGFMPAISGNASQYLDGSGNWSVPTGSGSGGGTPTPLSDATPLDLGIASAGTSGSASRGDHVHAHGDLLGGSLHAISTSGSAGFLPALSGNPSEFLSGSGTWLTPSSSAGVSLGTATPQNVGITGAVGTSGSASHEDHVHAHGNLVGGLLHNTATTGSAGFLPTLSGNAANYLDGSGNWTVPQGTNTLTLGAATPQSVNVTGSTGTSGSAAHEDHVHAHGNLVGGLLHNTATTGSAGFLPTLSGNAANYLDGSGGWSTPPGTNTLSLGAATPQNINTVGAVGTSGSASHEDHVHAHGNAPGGTLHNVATSGSAGFLPVLSGNPAQFLSGSGTWITPSSSGATLGSATPQNINTVGAVGTSGSASHEDHVHAHGNAPGGTLHSVATSGSAGFMPLLSATPTQYLSGSGTWVNHSLVNLSDVSIVTPAIGDAVLYVSDGSSVWWTTSAQKSGITVGSSQGVASRLIDGLNGVSDPQWDVFGYPSFQYASFDFGSVVSMKGIRIYCQPQAFPSNADYPNPLQFYGSTTGAFTGEQVLLVTNYPGGMGTYTLPFASTVTYRYYRLYVYPIQYKDVRIEEIDFNIATGGWANRQISSYAAVVGAATPQNIGTVGAVGTSGSASHEDHVHAHGNMVGGSLHAIATSGSAGFMPNLSGSSALYLNGTGSWTIPPGTGVMSVSGSMPIVSSGGSAPVISHATTTVTSGSYTNASIAVDVWGHLTAAASGATHYEILQDGLGSILTDSNGIDILYVEVSN